MTKRMMIIMYHFHNSFKSVKSGFRKIKFATEILNQFPTKSQYRKAKVKYQSTLEPLDLGDLCEGDCYSSSVSTNNTSNT